MSGADRLAALRPDYDLVVIGGGITGAGIAREAVRTGASVLLVERGDFASGTSGWSSKLVHGGLRYLSSGHWRLTLESVRERNRLLDEAPGLVDPQRFLMPVSPQGKPGRWTLQLGLAIYDLMAGRRASRWLAPGVLGQVEPELDDPRLLGAVAFEDARTDDARLVLRLLHDSRDAGATVLNYVQVEDLITDAGRVTGLVLHDVLGGVQRRIDAGLTINASGVWARQFAAATVGAPRLRPLRGSHLVLPVEALPIRHAVSWLHPQDARPVFAYPWEGAVLVGTTDLDHDVRGAEAPRITAPEVAYLIAALHARFPQRTFTPAQVLSSYAGVRPVVAGGQDAPSDESRESALWASPGLVSATGGKLTTFRITARRALELAARQRPQLAPGAPQALFDGARSADPALQRWIGRFGVATAQRLHVHAGGGDTIGATPYRWAELAFAARHESVQHLDDLLLRRTRLGLVTPEGGAVLLPQVRAVVQAELGWSDAHWAHEEARYRDLWQRQHALP